MKHTGPLPQRPYAMPPLKATPPEFGLDYLLTAIEGSGLADNYREQDGWARFDADWAPDIAGEIVFNVLSYVYEVGGEPALRRAIAVTADQFIEALEGDDDAEPLREKLARYAEGE